MGMKQKPQARIRLMTAENIVVKNVVCTLEHRESANILPTSMMVVVGASQVKGGEGITTT